jgi:hypothetical protein
VLLGEASHGTREFYVERPVADLKSFASGDFPMIPTLVCVAALAGFSNLPQVHLQDSHPGASQSSASSETHIPSAGVTLEALQSLPPPYNRWSGSRPPIQVRAYQPIIYPVYPSYGYGYPFRTYGFRPYGMGGYYPQGVGGRYPARIGWLFWPW